MKTGIAQISPVFLHRDATLAKVIEWIQRAGREGCRLVAFGETLVPAYPVWLARTDAARFDADDQKQIHSVYLDQSVVIDSSVGGDPRGHLAGVCDAARAAGVSVILGVAERPGERGGHTVYCSRVFIEGRGVNAGQILSIHRKLMPTYEERLSWGAGDGAGLVTHRVDSFCVGALNCWENWMPLARAALYASGEDLHVMLWPGGERLTRDITRFAALEGRSFVVSACSIIRPEDLPPDVPHRDRICAEGGAFYDGGSCIAGPDGKWIVEPVVGREDLLIADLDHMLVLRERQNFDAAGHYARPDVLRLTIDRRRQAAANWIEPT